MGRCVCLAPELTYVDSSHHIYFDIPNQVTGKATNEISETSTTTESRPQIPDRVESNSQVVPACTPFKSLGASFKGVARVHCVINLALAQRQRRDLIGPRSPLTPLRLTGESQVLLIVLTFHKSQTIDHFYTRYA